MTAPAIGDSKGHEVPPRRPRQRRTPAAQRQAILRAAIEVFLERGYANASIDAIVARAGGSKATVYAYFPTKVQLFAAVFEASAPRTVENRNHGTGTESANRF